MSAECVNVGVFHTVFESFIGTFQGDTVLRVNDLQVRKGCQMTSVSPGKNHMGTRRSYRSLLRRDLEEWSVEVGDIIVEEVTSRCICLLTVKSD